MNIPNQKAYSELLELLSSSPNAEQILSFAPTPLTIERVRYLLDGLQAGTLTFREKAELDALYQLVVYKRMLNIGALKMQAHHALA